MIAVIDGRMPCSAKARLKEICEVVELPAFSALDARVASHPDMLIFKLENKLFTCKSYYIEAKAQIDRIISVAKLELVLTDDVISSVYPNDIAFNAFVFGNFVIGNIKNISDDVKSYANVLGFNFADVKQGYAKCSSVVLDNAVISADMGICGTVRRLGGDALEISSNGVNLNGYDCGFIGGASGIYKNTLFFCGDISKHSDFDKISAFCESHGYDIVSLSDESLYDVGTIIFL